MRTYVRPTRRELKDWMRRCAGIHRGSRRSRGRSLPGLARRAGPHLRRSRGTRHQLPRGPRQVRAQQGARGLPAVQLDGQRLQGLQPCLRFLLRSQHPHLSRPERRPRFRAGDRGQGQRAGAAARRSSRRPSWKRELVAFGTNTDPYQWAEGRYELMPPMHRGAAGGRDADLDPDQVVAGPPGPRPVSRARRGRRRRRSTSRCRRSTRRSGARPSRTRPTRASGSRRWPKFNEAGIPSGVLVAPLMPGINDDPELVEEIVSIAEEAGATFVNGIALHLRPGREGGLHVLALGGPPGPGPALRGALRGRRLRRRTSERKRIGALVTRAEPRR